LLSDIIHRDKWYSDVMVVEDLNGQKIKFNLLL